jgi:hypothetical protein
VGALGLRVLEGGPGAASASLGSAPPGAAAGAAGSGSSCVLSLRAAQGGGASVALVPRGAALRYPFLTFGVSNLRTAARLAGKEGGGVFGGGGGGAPLATGAREAVFVLPGGSPAVRVLHLFRRNPAVSVTVGAADAGGAAAFFAGALGLARLGDGAGAGAAEAHPRQGMRSEVLAFGAPHNTTCLVVEEAMAGGAGWEEEGGGGEGALVLSVEASDVVHARAAFLERGLPASEPSASGSFVALCPNGYTFHVLPVGALS